MTNNRLKSTNSEKTNLTKIMVNTPHYYINNFPTVTDDLSDDDLSDVEKVLAGSGAKDLYSALSKVLKELNKPTTLNFLIKNVASEVVGQAFEIAFDPVTEQFKIDGEAIVGVVGKTATDKAVTAILTALGVGTGIVGVVVGGAARYLIWDALSETTEAEAIASFIDDVIQYVRGPVPVDIQIVDTNGNVLAGALYEEDIDETTEYEAITALIQQSQISSVIPQVGANRIRVVEKTIISPQVREYRLYNGALVDEISQTFDISKFDLLFLGTKNEPNTNGQIYAPLLFGESPFLFGSTDNQFFVPLPDTNGNIQPVGLYLGDIILGTDSEDRLDAFQAFGERVGLDRFSQKQKVLLLGLDGDDIIDGNVDDDFIVGGEGNDTINGGFGTDIAIFSDDFENYEKGELLCLHYLN